MCVGVDQVVFTLANKLAMEENNDMILGEVDYWEHHFLSLISRKFSAS